MQFRQIVCYIAGPLSAPTAEAREANIRSAEALACAVWDAGAVALCPHSIARHYTGSLPESAWLAGDLELLRRCDALILVPGWEQSVGTRGEVEAAHQRGQPVLTDLAQLRGWLARQMPIDRGGGSGNGDY